MSCHCPESGHRPDCGYFEPPRPKPVKGEIDEIRWNYDAAGTNKRKAYVHVKTDSGARLVIEVERAVGADEWTVAVRHKFSVKVPR